MVCDFFFFKHEAFSQTSRPTRHGSCAPMSPCIISKGARHLFCHRRGPPRVLATTPTCCKCGTHFSFTFSAHFISTTLFQALCRYHALLVMPKSTSITSKGACNLFATVGHFQGCSWPSSKGALLHPSRSRHRLFSFSQQPHRLIWI